MTDKIDSYLNQEMTGDELLLFENRLKSDPILAKEVKQQKEIILHIEEKGNKDLKSFLIELENNDLSSKANKKITGGGNQSTKSATMFTLRKLVTGVAASIAIVAASIWAFKTTQVNQTKDLFNEYYSPYPNDLVKIERSDTEMTNLQTAMTKYGNADYKAAIVDIDNYIATAQNEHLVNELAFFKAISNLSIGNIDEAKQALIELNADEPFEYSDKIKWYLALAHLTAGEESLAKRVLKNLIQSGQRYKLTEAKALLEEI